MNLQKWGGLVLVAALLALPLLIWFAYRTDGVLGALAGLAALAFVAGIGWFVRRELLARQRAEDLLRQLNMELAQRVEQRTAELRATEDRFRRLVEVSPEGIFINRDSAITFANPACLEIFGRKAEQVLGHSPLEFVHPDYHELIRQRVERMMQTGQPAPPLEEKILRPDGSERDVEIAAAPFAEKDGVSILVLMRDLTDKKRLEARFLRAQRLESIGTLAGGIAHDLNNVLTPIVMAVKLLRKNRPEVERMTLLEAAAASAQRGSDMIKQLLSFAGGGAETHKASIDLKMVFHEVSALLERTLPKSIQLQTQVAEELWPVLADPTQISQVLMNLCVNARDAMPEGGTLLLHAENVTLERTYMLLHPDARKGRYVQVSVQDTGIGIPAENLQKIFDPFFTTKEVGKGTGLGLSTALGIVQAHGGFINVYSEPNRGTKFTFYLPAQESVETRMESQPPPRLPVGHGECILLVDDEPHILATAKATLEAYGYHALAASSGEQALDLFKQSSSRVQAVVLDMMMPGMDGPATLRALREVDPRVRVLATSGLRAQSRVFDVLALGARGFLAKPYSDEQLLAALAEVLVEAPSQP